MSSRSSRSSSIAAKQKLIYRPLRRSGRKCRSVLERERSEMWRDKVRMKKNVDGLKVVKIPEKGRAVISTHFIPQGTYICEYSGELLQCKEAAIREEQYKKNDKIGCFMYYFMHRGEKYCVDATKEDETLGRLINHCKTLPNIKSMILIVDDTPHIIFLSIKDILPGEELVYDYGDTSTEAVTANPWLKL